ncbi:hypothetical protein [Chryseobacterium sp.]|uniref:hypothetical protein n=1 Tax=Chryseobacterium sp. TaxID=1871047 RepID=UPI003219634E
MEELIDKFELSFYKDIQSNEKIKNVEKKFTSRALPDLVNMFFEVYSSNSLMNFYKETNGFEARWEYDLKRNLCGRMNIIALEYVLESWEEKLYFEGADERLKYFRPLDIFTEEACVGILVDGSGDETLYYHEFGDSDIFSLDIDFKSYFDLSIDAKVFLYWQEYLVELVHGNQGVEVLFKTGMKEVFSDFDLETFTAKFDSLRFFKS